MSAKAYLFYANELVQEFAHGEEVTCRQYLHTQWGSKVYNEGYVYWPEARHNGSCWYRCDLTPVPLTNVPTIYRTMVLLLA